MEVRACSPCKKVWVWGDLPVRECSCGLTGVILDGRVLRRFQAHLNRALELELQAKKIREQTWEEIRQHQAWEEIRQHQIRYKEP